MSDSLLVQACHFIYRKFGRWLLERKNFREFFYRNIYNRRYETILKEANLKLLPEEYLVSVFLLLVAALVFSFLITIVVFFVDYIISQLIFYTCFLLVGLLGIFFYNYPLIRARNRRNEIDASLVYILPYLKILSKELSLQKIMEIITEFIIYKETRIEFEKINYFYRFLGYDIHSSIREAMRSCPSKKLSDLLNDLVTISNSGGSIYNYLSKKLENLEDEILTIEKKNIDSLLIFSQIYVVLLLITPLFFTIMVSILDLVQLDIASTNAVPIIFGTILFLPIFYIMFMYLIYFTKPLYKRLAPMKGMKNEQG